MKNIKVILIHGNGGATMEDHWLPSVKKELEKLGLNVVAKDFPDSKLARKKYWLPFLESLDPDENTILVGHSSGAVAAMRYAEKHKILGSVLIGACYTDFGLEEEKLSGWYDDSWDWEAIKNNQQWIVQFASADDDVCPIQEQRDIHKFLDTEYTEFADRGHFTASDGQTTFPELVEIIKQKVL